MKRTPELPGRITLPDGQELPAGITFQNIARPGKRPNWKGVIRLYSRAPADHTKVHNGGGYATITLDDGRVGDVVISNGIGLSGVFMFELSGDLKAP